MIDVLKQSLECPKGMALHRTHTIIVPRFSICDYKQQ